MSTDQNILMDTTRFAEIDGNITNLQKNLIPSNIPNRIDNLYAMRENKIATSTKIETILKLENKLKTDEILNNNFNGICVDLDTIGYTLTIEDGSTLLAL